MEYSFYFNFQLLDEKSSEIQNKNTHNKKIHNYEIISLIIVDNLEK